MPWNTKVDWHKIARVALVEISKVQDFRPGPAVSVSAVSIRVSVASVSDILKK